MQVDGYSLDAQRDKLTKYAEYQDMDVVKEFSDAGHSGKNINGRPEFSRMLEDIANGEDGVDFVLVFKLSRFGRNAADVLNSLQLMQDYGVNLICVEDGIYNDFIVCHEQGMTMVEIAKRNGISERSIYRYKAYYDEMQKKKKGKS